ncbi:MAG: 2-oxoacid:acceptor oxidoreductase subunit alpha [Anaerolineae bacterium]|nr:2-oxoacid:acceptor oxidoreductase subunit alpha [Anaerolineae bacterium]
MASTDLTIRIGGAAGDGVESSGAGFCTALTRGGLYVFGLPDYYSRIRGGHNFYSVRVSDQPLHAHAEPVHLLLALTEETIPRHRTAMAPGGAVVYDSSLKVAPEDLTGEGIRYISLPMSEMAQEKAGTTLARNTLALGFAAGITGFDVAPLESVIRDNFARKGQAVVDGNLAAVAWGYQQGAAHAGDYPYTLPTVAGAPPRMVLNGTEAFSMGALAGGCRFASGYPMTPGSPVLHWMAAHGAQYGVVVKHTEDEIAGINMAIGAAHMGARALVPTSGGGFSLMVEALGLAGITETPVVIYNAQRPGPATGLPTRNEQGDMLFMLHASQGEFPRFMLTPGTHEQAFEAGWRAFNLAEQFQTPVLVLSDHYLAVAVRTLDVDALDFDAVEIDRGALLSPAELDALEEPYLRYKLTPSGVSPRALPGHSNAVWVSASNEHDQRGAITEEMAMRVAQVDKRARKQVGMAKHVQPPTRYGPASAETTYVCWGSTYGPLREAVDRLNGARPGSANMLHVGDMWPFPAADVAAALDQAQRVVTVEVNSTGQLARLIRTETGRSPAAQILRYDGRPFSPEYIVERATS